MKFLLDGKGEKANDVTFGALFAALQTKGPTLNEVTGLMRAVLEYDRKPIKFKTKEKLCGIVGSGKDDLKTFNVSTCSAIVASGAGVTVIKNGSRADTSVAGTTDVLEELGVNVLAKANIMKRCLLKNKLGFFDAQSYFPKMNSKYVGKFHFFNPITFALSIASGIDFKRIVFGLANKNTEFTVNILKRLNFDHSLVVHGMNKEENLCMDEISVLGRTKISELKKGEVSTYYISPTDFGIKFYSYKDIAQGKTKRENAKILADIISGKESGGKRDIILLNAGALIYISDKVQTIREGIELAKESIDSGNALKKLEGLIKYSDGNILKLNKYL
jgi:anthranilate phosphoribosyltransferase